jgi:hypothetical protein
MSCQPLTEAVFSPHLRKATILYTSLGEAEPSSNVDGYIDYCGVLDSFYR